MVIISNLCRMNSIIFTNSKNDYLLSLISPSPAFGEQFGGPGAKPPENFFAILRVKIDLGASKKVDILTPFKIQLNHDVAVHHRRDHIPKF